jgi:hypothetical protein
MSGAHGHGHSEDHGHDTPRNKRIALLIAVLALVLALSETLGNGAQTAGLSYNIEASNLWSFFQAKTVRMTTVRTASELLETELAGEQSAPVRAAIEKRIEAWEKTAARYDSEPETQEGRKELATRAKAAEENRDRALAAHHTYELASAAVQIAIVLASAAIITGLMVLAWIAGALGIAGAVLTAIGTFAPTLLHFH